MDGLFEKLGLYDFFSMFMAGIISESITLIIASKCFGVNIEWTAAATWLFLIFGYFIGLILHEMKNIVENALRDNEKEDKQKEDRFKKTFSKCF